MIIRQYRRSLCEVILYASQVSEIIVFKPEYLTHKIWRRELQQYNLCKWGRWILFISSPPLHFLPPILLPLSPNKSACQSNHVGHLITKQFVLRGLETCALRKSKDTVAEGHYFVCVCVCVCVFFFFRNAQMDIKPD